MLLNNYLSSSVHLVIISFVSSLVLLAIMLFYRFIYPKKKMPLFAVFILIMLLPLVSMLRPGTYESGDLTFHTIESMVFYKSLSQGIVFPIWSGDMNYTYGYPTFLFFYPLPFYFSSLLHSIGFPFLISMKLVLAISFLFSGIFMYSWLRLKFSELGAFVGGLFYVFAPYHLIDRHFRVAVGEILALAFIPLALYSGDKFIREKKPIWLFIQPICIALLILSHPAVSMSGFGLIIIYLFTSILMIKNSKKKIKILLIEVLVLIMGVGLASFYLIPVIQETQYTLHHIFANGLNFIQVKQMLYSPWELGMLYQGHKGELSFLIGYGQILIIFISIFYLLKKKINLKDKNFLYASYFIIGVSIFAMTRHSRELWNILPLINNFQFTYRLMGIVIFAVSVVAAIVANNTKNKYLVYVLCFFIVFSTILNWGNRRNIPSIKDNELEKQIVSIVNNGGGLSQAATYWSDPMNTWADKAPKNHLEIVSGKGKIKENSRKINSHNYTVTAQTPMVVKENTLYFPGWIVRVNGVNQDIKILSNNKPKGVFSFNLKKGINNVQVDFTQTTPIKIGKFVTILTFISLLIFALIYKKWLKDF